MFPVYNCQYEIWYIKVDFEFLLWNIENGKINGITNWNKLCDWYNSNKLLNNNTIWINAYTLF